jgi:hypothetical protein
MKGYLYQLIRTADLKTSGHDLTGRTGMPVDDAVARAPARQRHNLWQAPTPWPTMHENECGVFLRHHYGKVILSYSPLAMETIYNELAMAVRLALLLGSTCGGSQCSPTSKVSEQRRQLLLKLVGYFNCCERWQKLDGDYTLGFWFLRSKIGIIPWAIYRGFGTIS